LCRECPGSWPPSFFYSSTFSMRIVFDVLLRLWQFVLCLLISSGISALPQWNESEFYYFLFIQFFLFVFLTCFFGARVVVVVTAHREALTSTVHRVVVDKKCQIFCASGEHKQTNLLPAFFSKKWVNSPLTLCLSPVGNRASSSVRLIARLTNAFQGFQTGEGRPAGRNWIFGSCRVLDAKPSDIDQASYSSKPFLSITCVSFNLFTNTRNRNLSILYKGCLIEFWVFFFQICRSKI
ncbi:hypothetical protein T07_7255, partial [Trichinella nelsoni]